MRRTRYLTAGSAAVAVALALAGCSGSGSQPAATSVAEVDGAGTTLTVWSMTGDLTPETLEAINAEFTEQTGATVDVQTQQWDGITTKVTTALSTNTPPDVLDLGNTQVPGYAANGGLLDLSGYADDLRQGRTWLGGLEDPGTVDGTLYAVPSFAGTRAVIYNKKVWADAGVTETPTTYEELTAALDTIKEANADQKDFSAFYLPGQYWYAGLQWIWDAGGDLAVQDGETWQGALSSPEAQQGLADFKAFRDAYSTPASATVNTDKPDQDQLFADGKAAAILGNGWEIGVIQKANPDLTDEDLGTFPFPGVSGENQPVMLGGSAWGIAAKSQNPELAVQWVKIAASPAIQDEYVYGKDGWIPNSTEAIEKATGGSLPELQQGFFTAALTSKSTPAAATWSTIEGDGSLTEFFSQIASGAKSPADAAKDFDARIADTLNQ